MWIASPESILSIASFHSMLDAGVFSTSFRTRTHTVLLLIHIFHWEHFLYAFSMPLLPICWVSVSFGVFYEVHSVGRTSLSRTDVWFFAFAINSSRPRLHRVWDYPKTLLLGFCHHLSDRIHRVWQWNLRKQIELVEILSKELPLLQLDECEKESIYQ